jgi:hypothetical protein
VKQKWGCKNSAAKFAVVYRRKLGRTTTTKKSFFLPDHDEMVVARTFGAENSSWLMWT